MNLISFNLSVCLDWCIVRTGAVFQLQMTEKTRYFLSTCDRWAVGELLMEG
jgi:hypothetical protein